MYISTSVKKVKYVTGKNVFRKKVSKKWWLSEITWENGSKCGCQSQRTISYSLKHSKPSQYITSQYSHKPE